MLAFICSEKVTDKNDLKIGSFVLACSLKVLSSYQLALVPPACSET